MKYLAALIVIGVMALWIPFKMDEAYARGVADGKASLLSKNPVSEELELFCAGLWVGEQHKKQERKNGRL